MMMQIIVNENNAGSRVDSYLAEYTENLSRAFIQKLILNGDILVDGKKVKSNYRLSNGQVIEYSIPEPVPVEIIPEDLELDIIYEDDDIIIVNKGKDMVVHPAAGHLSGTLVNALMHHCSRNGLSGINGELRPGIVHRIDKDTTGILVVCKNDIAHRLISEQLKIHSIKRSYMAIVYGVFNEKKGRIAAPIGRHPTDRKKMSVNSRNGKEAITNYEVIEEFAGKYSLIRCDLETGRTHQIRVHMASIHHPLVGDTVYGPDKDPFKLQGQALHAFLLGFIHPTTKKYVEFSSPLPDYYINLIDKLRRMT